MSELPFPKNPDYGTGATRRRVHLWVEPGRVRGLLSDIFHEMECKIEHDGHKVTSITGKMIRIPNTMCPSAPTVLPELLGMQVGVSAKTFYANGAIKRHCTHLFDLAFMVIAAVCNEEGEYIYEAIVPDSPDKRVPIDIVGLRDGVREVVWQIDSASESIMAPEEFAGKPVCKGFSGWAFDAFDDEQLMLPLLISRTCLLARGRAYIIDAYPGEPIAMISNIRGNCYAYSPERIDNARFVSGSVRDFTLGVKEGS
jgi:hypothetical protein